MRRRPARPRLSGAGMGTSARFRAAAVVAALLTAGFAADLLSRAGGRRTVLWVDDVGTFAAAVCATVACAVAAWRGDRRDRRGWALLCAGLAFWAFGEAAWGVYELSTGRVPFPSVADAGYLLAVPAVASALLLFPASGRLTARTRALLDGLVVAGALFMVSWVAVLGGVYRSGSGGAVDQAITLAYPIGDVVTGTMVLTVLATRRWRWRNPLVLVGLGLAIMAVSDSAYAWYTQTKTYSTGNPLDIGYVAAYLLLALAALRPEPTSPPEHRADGESRHADRSPLGGVVVPYTTVSVAIATWIAAAITGRRDDMVLLGAGWSVIVLVLARQFLTLLDNRRLNNALASKVSELAGRERELEQLAFHDPLTGLPNRSLFLHRVEQSLSAPGGDRVAVLFIDVDDFKTVNDSLGHEAGDQLLVQVAARITSSLRPGDSPARLGGDEFAVLITDVDDGAATPPLVAVRLLDAMRPPFDLVGRDVVARASIGIAVNAGRVETAELLRQADTAMYAAKNRGKGCYELFEARMNDDVVRRLEVQVALAEALAADQLTLHYQPIVDLPTGEVLGAEALARWDHPVLGTVLPSEFVAVAEQSGLVHDLGRWALLRACEEAANWPTAPLVSVNLSAVQLHDSGITGAVDEALRVTGLPADRLVLEITESVLLRHTDRTIARLRAFHALGVRLAIDDFGTGYSSLSYLPQFPADIIKIDQSFVRGVADPSGLTVLRGIVELATSLGMRTIAEGVETEDQAVLLRRVGCSAAQGFWFSPPVPPEMLSWTRVDLPAAHHVPGAAD